LCKRTVHFSEVHTGKYTSAADIWSFGVLLVEMIGGKLKSFGEEIPRKEGKLASAHFPKISELVLQTLHYNPSSRWSATMSIKFLETIHGKIPLSD